MVILQLYLDLRSHRKNMFDASAILAIIVRLRINTNRVSCHDENFNSPIKTAMFYKSI